MSTPEEVLGSARAVLGERGFSVTDGLDLTPWLASTGPRRVSGVRWVVGDGLGRRGFVAVVTRRAPLGVYQTGVGPLRLPADSERVTSSLYPDRNRSGYFTTLEEGVEHQLRSGLGTYSSPRPFAPNADVTRVLSHPERSRTAVVLTDLGRESESAALERARWRSVVAHPYDAEPGPLAAAEAVLDDLAAGVPLEWALRRAGGES